MGQSAAQIKASCDDSFVPGSSVLHVSAATQSREQIQYFVHSTDFFGIRDDTKVTFASGES